MKQNGRHNVTHFQRGRARPEASTRRLLDEAPLAIEVRGGERFTVLRTPGADRELAVGFLFSEGLIDGADDVVRIVQCTRTPNLLQVTLRGGRPLETGRNAIVASSCGLCGRQNIEALLERLEPVAGGLETKVETLYDMQARALSSQKLFRGTGASHAATLFDDSRIRVLREDIGRHNALDKVIGHALLHELPLAELGVLLTGRTSLELILKAARARIGLVAAVSAPSRLAVEAAERLGITLCGFVRDDEATVYCHEWRIWKE